MLRSRLAKTLTAISVVATLLTASPSGLALEPGGSFIDDNGSIHEAAIEAIADAGITKGCNPAEGNTRFCPKDAVTREQMATFLVRALGLPVGTASFVDVDGVHVADIGALAAAGITKGCNPAEGNTRFCPKDAVTREQMATFLVRALELPSAVSDFVDVAGVHAADVGALAAAGITKGCNPAEGNTRFCPKEPVTREQMASFLSRALELDPITPPPPLPADNPDDVVVIGDQNWLYFQETYEQECLDPTLFAKLVTQLEHAGEIVAASGRDFVYAVPPNKVVVHPGTAPGFAGSCAETNSLLLQAALTLADDPNRVDLWGPFAAATDQLYWKHDTHWNVDGALLGSELIATAAAPGTWDQLSLVTGPQSRQGDLATLIGVTWVEEYDEQTPTLTGVTPTVKEEMAGISGRPLVSYSSPVSSELADSRTAVIHDSFGMFFRNKLGPLFEEVTFVPTFSHPIPDDALPFITGSDQIVVEVVERNVLRDFLGAGFAGTLAAALADEFAPTMVSHSRSGEEVSFTVPGGDPGDLRYLIVELDTSRISSPVFMPDAGDLGGDPWAHEIDPDATRYGFEISTDSGAVTVPLPSSLDVTNAYVIVIE